MRWLDEGNMSQIADEIGLKHYLFVALSYVYRELEEQGIQQAIKSTAAEEQIAVLQRQLKEKQEEINKLKKEHPNQLSYYGLDPELGVDIWITDENDLLQKRINGMVKEACAKSPGYWTIFLMGLSGSHWKVVALAKESGRQPVMLYMNSNNIKRMETRFMSVLHPMFIKALEENENCGTQ